MSNVKTKPKSIVPSNTATRFAALAAKVPASALNHLRYRPAGLATAAMQMSQLIADHDAAFATLGTAIDRNTAQLLAHGSAELFARLDKAAIRVPVSERKISVALAEEANALRAVQRKLLHYHLDSDAVVSVQLKRLLEGSGYADLAADLVAYAELYETHRAELQTDARNYKAGDVARARKLAAAIRGELGVAVTTDAGAIELARTQAVVRDLYETAYLAAQLLFRQDPTTRNLFQPLGVAGRREQRARKGVTKAPKAAQ
jgi:hypothetical protein